jgi:hypothetical protein
MHLRFSTGLVTPSIILTLLTKYPETGKTLNSQKYHIILDTATVQQKSDYYEYEKPSI